MADNIVIGKLRAILGLDTAQYEAGARKASQSNAALANEVKKLRAELVRVKTDAASARGGLASLGSDIAKAAAGFFTAQAAFSAARQGIRLLVGEFKALTLGGAAVADVAENFQHLTSAAGQVGESLLGTLREGTHQTINDFELMKLVSADLAAGLRLTEAQFSTLSKGAFALAQATGGDVKNALDTMNDAMLTGRTRSIALLTGKIDETAAEREFAKSIGVTVDQLSEEGKLESRRIAILKAVGDATERLGEQTDGLDERVAQARVSWENFNHELGRSIATSPVLNEALSAINDEMKAAFGSDNAELVKEITGLVEDFAIVLADLSVVGVETARQVTRQWLFWKDGILGVLEAQFRLRASLRDMVGTAQYKQEALVLRAMADDLKQQQEEGLQRQLVLEGRFNATAAAIERIRGRMQVASRAPQSADGPGVATTRVPTSTGRFIDTEGAAAGRLAAAAARDRQDAQERAHRAAIERLREFDVAGEKLMADIAKDYQDRLEVMGQMTEDAERMTSVLDQLTQREQGAHLERANQETLRSVKSIAEARNAAAIDAQEAEFETAEFAIDQAARQGESWKQLYAMERDLRARRLQAAIADSQAQFEAETAAIDQSTTLGMMEFQALEDAHRASVERMTAVSRRAEETKRAEMAITTGALVAQLTASFSSALQLFGLIDSKSKALGIAAKAGAIAAAIMNTYEGATKALAKLPPPFSFAAAAAVIAAGLANVAIIKKTPVGYREGTRDLDFQDFGSRTRTELHGQEAVIPRGGGHRLASEIALSLRSQFAAPSALQGFTMPGAARPAVIGGAMTSGLRMSGQAGGVTHVYNTVTIQAWDASDMQRAVDTQLIPRLNVASQRNTGHYATEHRKGFGIRPPYGAR